MYIYLNQGQIQLLTNCAFYFPTQQTFVPITLRKVHVVTTNEQTLTLQTYCSQSYPATVSNCIVTAKRINWFFHRSEFLDYFFLFVFLYKIGRINWNHIDKGKIVNRIFHSYGGNAFLHWGHYFFIFIHYWRHLLWYLWLQGVFINLTLSLDIPGALI